MYMASAKLMASSTSRNADLKRKSSSSSSTKSSSISDPQIHHQNSINKNNSSAVSMTVDGILRNVYADNNRASTVNPLLDAEITLLDAAGAVTAISENEDSGGIRWQESARPKSVDDVWREIVAGRREKRGCKREAPEDNEMMTLEGFLAKADAVEEEGVKVELRTERLSGGIFAFDQGMIVSERSGEGLIGYGNGVEEIGGGRGKRRALLEPLDKAAQQRQRRMIKNRESAARSRERKQAYQIELEAMAVKLEEENELLLKEKAQRTKERLKQLMEKVVPVVEKRRPQRVLLRRVRSTRW